LGCCLGGKDNLIHQRGEREDKERRKEEGGRRKEEGGRRKEEGGRRRQVPNNSRKLHILRGGKINRVVPLRRSLGQISRGTVMYFVFFGPIDGCDDDELEEPLGPQIGLGTGKEGAMSSIVVNHEDEQEAQIAVDHKNECGQDPC
jgi:hypothetical protein